MMGRLQSCLCSERLLVTLPMRDRVTQFVRGSMEAYPVDYPPEDQFGSKAMLVLKVAY